MATNAEEVKQGDFVILKSGSPRLTVISVMDRQAQCLWFDTAGKLQSETLPTAALRVIPEEVGITGPDVDAQHEVTEQIKSLMLDLNIACNRAGALGLKVKVSVARSEMLLGETGEALVVEFSPIPA